MQLKRDFFRSAVWQMFLATFWFSLMNICARKLERLPVSEIVFFRCLLSMLFCYVVLYREKVNLKGTNYLLLVGRGIVGTVSLFMYIGSIKHMPLGTAVSIQYLSPVFSLIIGYLFLKQKITLWQSICFLTAISGVFIIKGYDHRVNTIFLLMGLCSACLSGLVFTLINQMKGSEHPMLVVFYFMAIGTITGFAGTVTNFVTPTMYEVIFILGIGITTQLGQINMTRSLQNSSVTKVGIITYSGIVLALVYGFFFFNESYNLVALLGIIMIVGAMVGNVYLSKKPDAVKV
ncbi:MAG: DMT family transporter [Bacteroidetes bacterium]|nr:DMT family transporter [Bacteroidota bacterium]